MTYIVRLSRLFIFYGYIDIRHTPTNPPSLRKIYSTCQRATGNLDFQNGACRKKRFYIRWLRRLFTKSLKRIREDLKARTFVWSTNNRTRRRIRSNVCCNFCKGISCFYVSCRVPRFIEFSTGTYTSMVLLWMCAKRRLPSHPRLMVILLGEIEGFSFPAKKSVEMVSPCPSHSPSVSNAPSCRSLFPTLRCPARDDDVHESFPFLRRIFR